MRVCEKCSRDFTAGSPPDCDDPDCPFRDGLAVLEGEDKTLVDPDFDRDQVLQMMHQMRAEEAQVNGLDEHPLDVTQLYAEEDERPEFVDELLRRTEERDDSDDDVAEAMTQALSVSDEPDASAEVHQQEEDAPRPLVSDTASQPGPETVTDVDHDVADDDRPATAEEGPDANRDRVDPDSPTGRMDAVDVDALIIEEEQVAATQPFEPPDVATVDEESDADADDATSLFDGGDRSGPGDDNLAEDSAATVEISHLERAPKPDHHKPELKPKLTLAELRASLKKRNTGDDTAEAIQTLEELTEDPGAPVRDVTDEEDEYVDDETAQMDAADVDAIGMHPERTNQDGTLQLDDGDLLDFADGLLDEQRTVEFSKGVSTNEATRPVPVQQDTTQQDQPSPATIEVAMGQPPQTYAQPPAPGPYPQQPDPYGSSMNQYPLQEPAGSGMYPPQGPAPYGQPPTYGQPPHGQYPPAGQPNDPYAQQYDQQPMQPNQSLPTRKGPRIETLLIVGIIVLAVIGVSLALANFLR